MCTILERVDAVIRGTMPKMAKAEVLIELLPEAVAEIAALEAEVNRLRRKLERVRDVLMFAANSDGGIVAEIDAALADRSDG